MKKQLVAPLMLAALFSAPSHSQSTGEGEKGKFTITPAVVSDYIWRGQSQGGMSFQPAITYEKGPWSYSISLAYPLDEKLTDTVYPEFDLSAAYEFSLLGDYFKIKPGVLAYTYPRAEGQYKAIIEPTVTFALDAKELNVSFTAYYDVIQKGPTYELAAGYSISLGERVGIDLSALIGKYELSNNNPDEPPKIDTSGSYWTLGLSIPIAFSQNTSLVPSCNYHKGFDRKVLGVPYTDENFWVFGISYSYSF